MTRIALVALAMAATGCKNEKARPFATGFPSDSLALDRAWALCENGDVEEGLAAIDSVLAVDKTADALVVRALCRWVEFHDSGVAETGDAIEEDLTSALAHARVEDADQATIARIYSHRAALRRARGAEDWALTLADLDAAVATDPGQPIYVLDRAVAQLRHGDSAAALLDLDRFLQLDTVDVARGDLARQLRDDLQPVRKTP